MKSLASGVEASLEIGFDRPRSGRSLAGSYGTCAIGKKLELAGIVVLHVIFPHRNGETAQKASAPTTL
jgi:hypothetical protein